MSAIALADVLTCPPKHWTSNEPVQNCEKHCCVNPNPLNDNLFVFPLCCLGNKRLYNRQKLGTILTYLSNFFTTKPSNSSYPPHRSHNAKTIRTLSMIRKWYCFSEETSEFNEHTDIIMWNRQ